MVAPPGSATLQALSAQLQRVDFAPPPGVPVLLPPTSRTMPLIPPPQLAQRFRTERVPIDGVPTRVDVCTRGAHASMLASMLATIEQMGANNARPGQAVTVATKHAQDTTTGEECALLRLRERSMRRLGGKQDNFEEMKTKDPARYKGKVQKAIEAYKKDNQGRAPTFTYSGFQKSGALTEKELMAAICRVCEIPAFRLVRENAQGHWQTEHTEGDPQRSPPLVVLSDRNGQFRAGWAVGDTPPGTPRMRPPMPQDQLTIASEWQAVLVTSCVEGWAAGHGGQVITEKDLKEELHKRLLQLDPAWYSAGNPLRDSDLDRALDDIRNNPPPHFLPLPKVDLNMATLSPEARVRIDELVAVLRKDHGLRVTPEQALKAVSAYLTATNPNLGRPGVVVSDDVVRAACRDIQQNPPAGLGTPVVPLTQADLSLAALLRANDAIDHVARAGIVVTMDQMVTEIERRMTAKNPSFDPKAPMADADMDAVCQEIENNPPAGWKGAAASAKPPMPPALPPPPPPVALKMSDLPPAPLASLMSCVNALWSQHRLLVKPDVVLAEVVKHLQGNNPHYDPKAPGADVLFDRMCQRLVQAPPAAWGIAVAPTLNAAAQALAQARRAEVAQDPPVSDQDMKAMLVRLEASGVTLREQGPRATDLCMLSLRDNTERPPGLDLAGVRRVCCMRIQTAQATDEVGQAPQPATSQDVMSVEVRGGGDCGFWSMSHFLGMNGVDMDADAVRAMTVAKMQHAKSLDDGVIAQEDIDEMKHKGAQAHETIIGFALEAAGVQNGYFHVVQEDVVSGAVHGGVQGPDDLAAYTGGHPHPPGVQPPIANFMRPCHVLLVPGHFHVVCPTKTPFPQPIPEGLGRYRPKDVGIKDPVDVVAPLLGVCESVHVGDAQELLRHWHYALKK